MNSYSDVITQLKTKLDSDAELKDLVCKSLVMARKNASGKLDDKLFQALAWPQDIPAYIDYLVAYSRWVPNQFGDAWKKPGYDQNQEVFDRLCHFHWLINQPVASDGKPIAKSDVVQSGPWFSKWLIKYARLWGSFLDSTESFNETTLWSFIQYAPQYNVLDSMVRDPHSHELKPNSPSGWLTFNQFFARELNPGLRPIDDPKSNTTIVSPADCTFKKRYDIDADSKIEDITIKGTHKYASIPELLGDSPYKDDFANGTFVHYFLGPGDYHRFHTPVSGEVLECKTELGNVYLDVNITGSQFDAPDSAEGGYEFSQARGIIIQDTNLPDYENIGKVAIIPVGMSQVSSVNMIAETGKTLLKGDEFGYFLFGGSDIIMLFQQGINLNLIEKEVHYKYGTKVGECNPKK